MKIYLHEFNIWKNEITTKEIEAEETEKTYSYPYNEYLMANVSKERIGKLDGVYGGFMYTLTPDRTPFIDALLESNANKINRLTSQLKTLEERRTFLLAERSKQ